MNTDYVWVAAILIFGFVAEAVVLRLLFRKEKLNKEPGVWIPFGSASSVTITTSGGGGGGGTGMKEEDNVWPPTQSK